MKNRIVALALILAACGGDDDDRRVADSSAGEVDSANVRGTFVIDPTGTIKTMEVHDNAIARDVTETVRKLKAAQYVASHPNEVCPAKWKEGAKTIAPSLDLVGKI